MLKHHPAARRAARLTSTFVAPLMTGVVRLFLGLMRLLGADRASAFCGFLMRGLGPLTRSHQTAVRNLAAALPEKTEAERAQILRDSWDNLGRTIGEYPFLQELMDFDYHAPENAVRTEVVGTSEFLSLLEHKGPAIIFSAHLGNWELPGVVAARYGLDTTIVFRPPNNKSVARAIEVVRANAMGRLLPTGPGAALAMVAVLEAGGRLGMLADQHFNRGLIVPFMGRPALTNPVIAKLARRFDCQVRGTRCVRLPGGRFRLELTPPLDMPRDAEGHIDDEALVARITAVIEGWVRENPGQWLWQHRRWRVPEPAAVDPSGPAH